MYIDITGVLLHEFKLSASRNCWWSLPHGIERETFCFKMEVGLKTQWGVVA